MRFLNQILDQRPTLNRQKDYLCVLIAIICYYRIHKNEVGSDGFIRCTGFDFDVWLGRKASDEINALSKIFKENNIYILEKQSTPYKIKIDKNYSEVTDDEDKIYFEDIYSVDNDGKCESFFENIKKNIENY